MKALNKKHLLVLTVCAIDLISLIVTLVLKSWIFIVLFLSTILIITVVIPIWFTLLLAKQPMASKEYYVPLIKEKYHDLDKELLTKMFEMRMTNQRNIIFTYLAFLLTGFLAIVFTLEKLRQYSHNPYDPELLVLLFAFGIMVLIYASFRLDRETINELKELLKAMRLLNKLKKESDESTNPIEKSDMHD